MPPVFPLGSAFSFTYILCLRSRSSSAPLSSRLCLPCCQSHYRQRGRFPPPALPGFPGTTNPSATLSPVSRLPGAPGYTAYLCSADFSPGRGGLLQLLSASSSPCRRYHPARVSQRFSQSALRHAAFVLRKRTRPPDLMCSRGYLCVHSRYGPVTRRPPFTVAVSMGFRSSVSLLPAIQATGLWLLPRRVCSPAERASLCWTHSRKRRFFYQVVQPHQRRARIVAGRSRRRAVVPAGAQGWRHRHGAHRRSVNPLDHRQARRRCWHCPVAGRGTRSGSAPLNRWQPPAPVWSNCRKRAIGRHPPCRRTTHATSSSSATRRAGSVAQGGAPQAIRRPSDAARGR